MSGDTTRAAELTVIVNGETQAVPAGVAVAGLLARLGLATTKVAVERNGEIVARSAQAGTVLAEGDRIEIIAFVGGG